MYNSVGHATVSRSCVLCSRSSLEYHIALKVSTCKLSLSKLSNAFSKLMKLTNIAEFHSTDCSIIMRSVAIWSVYDPPFLNPAWFFSKIWIYSYPQPFKNNSVKNLPRNRQERYSPIVITAPYVTFLWNFDEIAYFPIIGYNFFDLIASNYLCKISIVMLISAFRASGGMWSGPQLFEFHSSNVWLLSIFPLCLVVRS